MKFPLASRAILDFWKDAAEIRSQENRELRTALRNANDELRRLKALIADIRTDPDHTVVRIQKAFHEPKS